MNGFASVAAMALLLVRPGMIVIGTPFLGAVNAPPQLRVGLTILVALLLASTVRVPVVPAAGLAIVILREVAIGLALALSVRVLVFGAELAGHFTGYQIGLSLGSLIDPQSGVRNNVLAILYANVVAVICLATNVHHAVLRALAESYQVLPIGLGGAVHDSLAGSVAHMLGLVFVMGTRIAAPVIIVLLLIEVALGLLGKVAPTLNVMIAGAPVRLVVGLLVMAISMTALPGLVSRYVPNSLDLAAEIWGGLR